MGATRNQSGQSHVASGAEIESGVSELSFDYRYRDGPDLAFSLSS